MSKKWMILIVDDEHVMRESLAAWLMEDGYIVDTAASGREAINMAREKEYAIYFIDLKMPPGIDGIETMMEIRNIRPDASVIIITAYATVDTAITAMKEGAQEYIVKPCNPQEISLLVERIVRLKSLERENLLLRQRLTKQYSFHDIISKNPKMLEIFELIKDVASLKSTVLIQGESGTGKEMIARAIHLAGERAEKSFVAISCAALAETLLESELFGHEKGAFTGAIGQRKGKFEAADGGTLFLDEIGDVSPKLQGDLLRVLQERTFFRVGGSEEIAVDVRVIAACNVDLQEAVREGQFREDLFYRLCQVKVVIPPLRDRPEDIPQLVKQFVDEFAGDRAIEFDGALMKRMLEYSWPGNVRELQNLVRVACALAEGNVITMQSIPNTTPFAQYQRGGRVVGARREAMPREVSISIGEKGTRVAIDEHNAYDLGKSWRDYEILIIAKSYQLNKFNAARTAAELGIATATLYKRIKEWNLKDSSNPLYQDPFTYKQGTTLDDYVPRIFKAALAAAGGRATQAIANLHVSQGYFYKVMKRMR
ncbi:MAG: sigma-54-dependent Fis family transcriptional regulator [candidate division Zixibacteria bacterium]|nr:sigma-54-dependent Fis family transcriptional regulator [candidate division Zixibacteria bacterium]